MEAWTALMVPIEMDGKFGKAVVHTVAPGTAAAMLDGSGKDYSVDFVDPPGCLMALIDDSEVLALNGHVKQLLLVTLAEPQHTPTATVSDSAEHGTTVGVNWQNIPKAERKCVYVLSR